MIVFSDINSDSSDSRVTAKNGCCHWPTRRSQARSDSSDSKCWVPPYTRAHTRTRTHTPEGHSGNAVLLSLLSLLSLSTDKLWTTCGQAEVSA